MNDIKIWAQMFFDDGSVTEGSRISHVVLDSDELIENVITNLLKSVNREEGLLLLWGAGEIRGYYATFYAEVLEISALEPSSALLPLQMKSVDPASLEALE